MARIQLKTLEPFFHVCLQFPNDPSPSWYIIWIKTGQTLINRLEKKKTSILNTRLVQIPSSYLPYCIVFIGSEAYALSQGNARSSSFLFCNIDTGLWRNAPNMTVPRAKALVVVFNGKIYVMGGCAADDESANWGEVFDPKTQTWEPLPDPGAELRFTSIRKIQEVKGKLYIRSNENKDSIYDPNENKWHAKKKSPSQCNIDNVWYYCDKRTCYWYDANLDEWKVVKGLASFNKNHRLGMIEIAEYGGKLLILWDKFMSSSSSQHKEIWCAVIALGRDDDMDEVWGTVEWASVVLRVPSSYVFLHSLHNMD